MFQFACFSSLVAVLLSACVTEANSEICAFCAVVVEAGGIVIC